MKENTLTETLGPLKKDRCSRFVHTCWHARCNTWTVVKIKLIFKIDNRLQKSHVNIKKMNLEKIFSIIIGMKRPTLHCVVNQSIKTKCQENKFDISSELNYESELKLEVTFQT